MDFNSKVILGEIKIHKTVYSDKMKKKWRKTPFFFVIFS